MFCPPGGRMAVGPRPTMHRRGDHVCHVTAAAWLRVVPSRHPPQGAMQGKASHPVRVMQPGGDPGTLAR
jgi:hypothetical protein